MKYLQSIKPFQLIAALATRGKDKDHLENTALTHEEKEESDPPCSCQDAEEFIVSLGLTMREQQRQAEAVRRKVSLFEGVEIEPHYLEDTLPARLLQFEFHLGSHAFLDRTESLHQQQGELTKVAREVLKGKAEAVNGYFLELQEGCDRVTELIEKVASLRKSLILLREQREFTIGRILARKRIIKEKLRLLRDVKTKNQTVFLEINNIDQAFATEQARVKLYRKLNQLTELDRSKYINNFRGKLISICRGNKRIVEEGLHAWVAGQLSEKQVQKLAFMIYFMERQEVYRDHEIRVDYSVVDRQKLKQEVNKIFEWNGFHYVKDVTTKDRIHEFLHFLIKRIE